MAISEALLATCVVLIPVSALAYLVLLLRFLSRLQRTCPRVFEELGEPSLIMNNTISNNLKTVGFLLKGNFDVLEEQGLARSAQAVRIVMIVLIVSVLTVMGLMWAHWSFT
jgi:hypothetical protein